MRGWKSLSAALALSAALLASPASLAMDRIPYDREAVVEAQQNGEKIILGIWAVWCGTCQAQIAILDSLADDPRFDAVTIFHIDYDLQKPVMRLVGAEERSQMIAFDGAEEIGRLIGSTDPIEIEAFLLDLVDR